LVERFSQQRTHPLPGNKVRAKQHSYLIERLPSTEQLHIISRLVAARFLIDFF